ncbi:MAG: hypothetical protein IKI78_06365, partial [Clostridia bacterium]|nr:hypothetical protein [Clostridia bacterium]
MKKSIKSVICLLLGAVMLFTAVLPTVYAFDDDPMNGRFGSGKREPLNEAQEEVVYTHDPRFDTGYTRVEMIDVSSHNGSIDWSAVAASGIRYAMIRAGYRGYGSDGILNADSRFRENVAGAIAAGIKVGAYFYTQAKSNAEAVAEADFTLSLVSGFDLKMPIVYDCEFAESGGRYTGRFYDANLSAYQIASMCNAFCSR